LIAVELIFSRNRKIVIFYFSDTRECSAMSFSAFNAMTMDDVTHILANLIADLTTQTTSCNIFHSYMIPFAKPFYITYQ
jgi:hypothetical protein